MFVELARVNTQFKNQLETIVAALTADNARLYFDEIRDGILISR